MSATKKIQAKELKVGMRLAGFNSKMFNVTIPETHIGEVYEGAAGSIIISWMGYGEMGNLKRMSRSYLPDELVEIAD